MGTLTQDNIQARRAGVSCSIVFHLGLGKAGGATRRSFSCSFAGGTQADRIGASCFHLYQQALQGFYWLPPLPDAHPIVVLHCYLLGLLFACLVCCLFGLLLTCLDCYLLAWYTAYLVDLVMFGCMIYSRLKDQGTDMQGAEAVFAP